MTLVYETIESSLRRQLLSLPDIASVVGDRIFPNILPEKPTYPALVMRRVASVGTLTHAGRTGLSRVRLQIDCLALTYAAAHDLAERVRRSADGFRGAFGGREVPGAFLETWHDTFEPDSNAHRVIQDWTVWTTEEAPRWRP